MTSTPQEYHCQYAVGLCRAPRDHRNDRVSRRSRREGLVCQGLSRSGKRSRPKHGVQRHCLVVKVKVEEVR